MDKATLDISLQKQYALYGDAHHTGNYTPIDALLNQQQKLILNTYQSFIANLFNPLADINSILLIHGTGTGKTITSLSVANEYQKQYRTVMRNDKNSAYNDIRSIVIVGFTKDIFKAELINHPEFGFVSSDEYKELKDLQANAHENTLIMDKLNTLQNKLFRRISDRRMNGIFQFYGYRQLFLRIINVEDFNKKTGTKNSESSLSYINDITKIISWIKDGSIRLNHGFIQSLSHSLFICDEVHNVYYKDDVNIYGLTLQIINDYFAIPKLYNPNWDESQQNCLRFMYLSATPFNSNPEEIVPIINLLYSQKDRIQMEDIFDSDKNITKAGRQTIIDKSSGHISYIMDDNPIQYPEGMFKGETIPLIPYLKFVRCPMSKEHQTLYDSYLKSRTRSRDNKNNEDEDEDEGEDGDGDEDESIEKHQSNTLKDFVFKSGKKNKDLLYQFPLVRDEIKEGISPYKETSNKLLISDTFKLDKLHTYSSKYFALISEIMRLKGQQHGKIFVYHPFVKGSGVDLLCRILRTNGILEDNEQPGDSSICMDCDLLFKEHNNKTKCAFRPVRFLTITGYLSKNMQAAYLRKYNSPDNTNGESFKILLGSKAMSESHTLKACRHLMVVHQPASISKLIQIVGRGIRKNSHELLPKELRTVEIQIFVTSTNSKSKEILSLEEESYKIKMDSYKSILSIERILFDQSIDYLINFRFKTRETPKLIGDTFPLQTDMMQKYKAMKQVSQTQLQYNLKHNIFYIDQELNICKTIIKRILLEIQPIVMIDTLISMVRNPPFNIEMDTQLISEGAIRYAIQELSFGENDFMTMDKRSIDVLGVGNKPVLTPNQIADTIWGASKVVTSLDGNIYKIIHSAIPNGQEIIYLEDVYKPVTDLHELIASNNFVKNDMQIDLEVLLNDWTKFVQIDEIVNNILEDYNTNKTIKGAIEKRISQFTLETHTKLIEYIIIMVTKFVFNKKKSSVNANMICDLLEYYESHYMVITIKDAMSSVIAPTYKKYAIMTGTPWKKAFIEGKLPSKINMSDFPIGHYVMYIPKVISFDAIMKHKILWTEYNNIYKIQQWEYPDKLIIYYERIDNSIFNMLKIRDLTDPHSKGITMKFLPMEALVVIAKKLKIPNKCTNKSCIIELVEAKARSMELEYRKTNSKKKIIYYPYEALSKDQT